MPIKMPRIAEDEMIALVAYACQGLLLLSLSLMSIAEPTGEIFPGQRVAVWPVTIMLPAAGVTVVTLLAARFVSLTVVMPRGTPVIAVLGLFLPAMLAFIVDEFISESLCVCGMSFVTAAAVARLSGIGIIGMPKKLPMIVTALILAWAFSPDELWAQEVYWGITGSAIVFSGVLAGCYDTLSERGFLVRVVVGGFALVSMGMSLMTVRAFSALFSLLSRSTGRDFDEERARTDEARERARRFFDME
ncbi:MAG: hypothetical protein LBQ79_00160 [Deltaproteobacteria bacterium]|jgi:hypothetical protein|nr:hypothetical protein [Deltaproteobacteria bacterium]